jgi:hypothetical protein
MNLPNDFEESEQPDSVEFQLADGIFVKSGLFKRTGRIVPQHSHDHDHSSFIATGGVLAWADSEFLGAFEAPCSIFIKAHVKHTFKTTKDNTLILCIHNVSRTGLIDIHELHEVRFP